MYFACGRKENEYFDQVVDYGGCITVSSSVKPRCKITYSHLWPCDFQCLPVEEEALLFGSSSAVSLLLSPTWLMSILLLKVGPTHCLPVSEFMDYIVFGAYLWVQTIFLHFLSTPFCSSSSPGWALVWFRSLPGGSYLLSGKKAGSRERAMSY